ncbi:methyltransferase domain-containing protein [Candidatus Kaiserbacteria bacterium]|nr:methyltransferase domain-containing protein [Candidatus Kaiserbacteria bacterium]
MNSPIGGQFVQPVKAVSHFHLKPGDVVADYGAGSGFFLKALTEAVGETGKVYAVEIQKALVEKLGEQAHLQGLTTVHPLWCDLEEVGGIKIADGELDAVILVNTLFLIEDKATAITEMLRTLRRGGQFIIIDWTESFGSMGPQPGHIISKTDAIALLETHGCTFEREFPAGDHHYGVVCKK